MAVAVVAGADWLVGRYYRAEDQAERDLLRAVFARAVEIDGDKREDQAVRIVEALAASLKPNRRRR